MYASGQVKQQAFPPKIFLPDICFFPEIDCISLFPFLGQIIISHGLDDPLFRMILNPGKGGVMQTAVNREFGGLITRLVQKEDLSREEAKGAFYTILKNETTDNAAGSIFGGYDR